MATTPNYDLNLPQVGGDNNTWGSLTNDNWTIVDGQMKTNADAAGTAQTTANTANGTANTALANAATAQAAADEADDTADAAQAAADAAQATANTALTDASAANTNANTRVLKSGDTMTGALTLPSADPTTSNQAARKLYVDHGEQAYLSRYLFNTATAGGDPGTGYMAFNAVNYQTTTSIVLSATTNNGDAVPVISSFVAGALLMTASSSRIGYYKLIAAVDNTTYFTLTVEYLSGFNSAAPGADTYMLFSISAPIVPSAVSYTEYDLGVFALDAQYNQAISAAPLQVAWFAKCSTATDGFAVNDYVSLSAISVNTDNSDDGAPAFSYGFNATSLFATSRNANSMRLINKTTGAYTSMTLSSWRLVARVFT